MAITTKQVLKQFYEPLVDQLPMHDTKFIAKLHSGNFLPGELKDQIESQSTPAKKASHFLDHSNLTEEKFNQLVKLMKNGEFEGLKELANQIETKLRKKRKKSTNSKGVSSSEPILKKRKLIQIDVTRLKARYLKHVATDDSDWPQTYIRLALIKGEKVTRADKNLEEITKMTLQGQVDEILLRKEPLGGLEDIFHYQNKPCPRLILIMGGPGIGKTTLANEICIRWARDGFLADDFYAVILIPLRSVQERLFEDVMKEYIGEDYHKLIESAGSGCLIILEGLDEMAIDRQQSDTFLVRVIKECTLLEEAIIMITSRPHACKNIEAGRRVEVVGFGEKEIREFVEKSFPGDHQFVSEFLTQLNEYPQLHSLCYVPMNLAMVLDIYQCYQKKMPSTLTELYQQFIVMILQRQVKKGNFISSTMLIEDSRATKIIYAMLVGVPQEAVGIVMLLSELSYRGFFDWYNEQERVDKRFCINTGITEGKVPYHNPPLTKENYPIIKEKFPKIIFTVKDLTQCGINVTKNFDGFGLLKATHIHQIPTDTTTYNFTHLTIQEFLCVLYISTLSQQEQLCLLREHFCDYSNVFMFLSGLTGLQSDDLFKSVLFRPTWPVTYTLNSMTIIRCVYESKKNTPLPSDLASIRVSLHINENDGALSSFDCLCISYVLSYYPIFDWLDLSFCNIGDKGAELLAKHFPNSSSTSLPLSYLRLYGNHITELVHVIKIVKASNHCLSDLDLGLNKFGDNGMLLLFEELQHNCTLRFLNVDDCGLSEKGAILIGKLLIANCPIEFLSMLSNSVGDDGIAAIAEALTNNNSVKELYVQCCNITFTGASSLAKALSSNNTIEKLELSDNFITVIGARRILQSVISSGVCYEAYIDDRYLKDAKVKELIAVLMKKEEANRSVNVKGIYYKAGKRFYLKPQSKIPLSYY